MATLSIAKREFRSYFNSPVAYVVICIGLFALFAVIQVPDQMNMGIMVILGAGLLHLFFVAVIGRLPRLMGALLTLAYGVFLYTGFMG